MNSTHFFNHPLQTYHFLSVINSLDVLSNIFFNKTLLAEENLYQPISVINCLCKYLYKNNNINATIDLGKELIKKSDLYGSKENETIHIKYVNSMLDRIITSVVFSKFGNTFGYLSAIVRVTGNLTLPFIKATIFTNLRNTKFLNADNTTSQLTKFSIRRITEKIVFPLFPETKSNDMQIVDVDYIYAQAGLMLSRAARINSQNVAFNEYIAMSQTIEEGVRLGQINPEALQIFQLPALMYHFSKQKIRSKKIKTLIKNPDFINKTMHQLFSHLNMSYYTINQLQDNYVYQFHKAQSGFKHRKELAQETLKQHCPMDGYESQVTDYMNHYSDYKCPNNDKMLPDLNALFSAQNERIADKYFNLEKYLIRKTLGKELVQLMEQPNVTVFRITTLYGLYPRVFPLFHTDMVPSQDIDLFTITDSSEKISDTKFLIYAFKRTQTGLSIFTNEGNFKSFLWKIGVKRLHNVHLIHQSPPLKSPSEPFDNFAENVAKPWKTKYAEMLYNQGYDATTREKVIDFSKHLIPFYSCVESIESGTVAEIAFACYVDTLTIIPLGSFAINFGVQALKAIARSILSTVEKGFIEFGLKNAILTAFRESIPLFAMETGKTLSDLTTKELFQIFALILFRSVDPGIELAYTLGKAGIESVTKCFAVVGRRVSILSKFIKTLRKVKQPVIFKIGTFHGHDVYVNSISGKDGYGVKFFNFEGKIVELRRILGYQNEMPVVLVSNSNDRKRIYQIMDLRTGKLQPTRWKINANSVLQLETKPLAVRLKTIQVEGLGGKRCSFISRKMLRKNLFTVKEISFLKWEDEIDSNIISDLFNDYVLDDYDILERVFHYYFIHRELPDWIKNYKLTNVNDYIFLRFKVFVENNHLTKTESIDRITKLHKELFRSNIDDHYGKLMHSLYKKNRLYSIVSIEDFCAISNYLSSDFDITLQELPEAWFTLQAFYRAAFRFVDLPSHETSECFYVLHKATEEIVDKEKAGLFKTFDCLTKLDSEFSEKVRNLGNIVVDDKTVNVLYEVHVNHRYMVVDTEKIFPSGKIPAVLLPKTKFSIEKAGFERIEGNLVYKVTLNICPSDKMYFIATLNKNIEFLNRRINLYNSYLDDFDLSLFN